MLQLYFGRQFDSFRFLSDSKVIAVGCSPINTYFVIKSLKALCFTRNFEGQSLELIIAKAFQSERRTLRNQGYFYRLQGIMLQCKNRRIMIITIFIGTDFRSRFLWGPLNRKRTEKIIIYDSPAAQTRKQTVIKFLPKFHKAFYPANH